ncbi:MAG TPA: serine/threonine-protein kinase [Polyangia bacterium]|nr:serine/threonine-protein kinase [Polyangia bacterium]
MSDADAPPRARLGPYRLIRRLGRGGMAEVFLATAFGASGFEKKVAIKTLLPELQGNGELERLLIEEAKLGGLLSHRNLIGVQELGVDAGVYWVRMDYVDGLDLKTRLERGLPPPELALLIAEEVALALAYVHAFAGDDGRPLGLVHRDVSPSNILVSRAGEVKLADFGVAKATGLADITRANVRKGKYAYMSPEQVAGAPLGPASDQFGLGVTLMELLCGRRPYDGETPLATMERIREAAPPDVSALDVDLQELVRGCLAKAPEARFEDLESLGRAIAAARARRPPSSLLDLARWLQSTEG